ncbi:amidase [Caulobacter sp. BK020]|uniref:amidase n=1 Tax=Caulobacter sp. BK020 TaxID=2512117 RepID=UPI00104DE136|nr:amidase [Caulobacter sp. BK020]TCS02034.1 aspartyl-tRNA(Asn)/glutamyl-tRNA(Gln) amidotransferase subunit A [Caulobacter sp. BK020]
MSELPDLTATDLSRLYAAGNLSPVEVTSAVLARIEAWEPNLAATWALDAGAALEAARASEARWRSGEALSPLDGAPVTIKELIATRGVPKPLGSAASDLVPQPVDAPPAARLREAGAVILAKTTNPDFGMLSSGLSSFHKLARNPWNLAKTPGGSSAGAGSAAAAGYGPLHLGTDIGGSIRLPAGWCGVYGLKPSNGRIPIDPPYIGRCAGPMTRTVEDAALAMTVLSAPDCRDYMSLPPASLAWNDLDIDLAGLRIGLMLDAGVGLQVEPEVAQAVTAAAQAFEAAGAIVEPFAPYLTREMLDGLDLFWRTRSLNDLDAMDPERAERALPYILAWARAARGADGLSVYRGFNQIQRMREVGAKAFQSFDFVLSPTAPAPAFDAHLPSPTNDPARPFEHIGFTVAFNMTEQPAASINCGYTGGGLPIGLQIVGRRFDDLGVLRLSRAWERLRPVQRPWPAAPFNNDGAPASSDL